MIFAEKLIQLRKKAGWSQEELAEQMRVTRQSVSKWEGAQSIPDIGKIIQLSELFGVSIDYLVKDELEAQGDVLPAEEESPLRRVSMEEASEFLRVKAETAGSIALGALLCVLSPICLLLLGAASEVPGFGISENAAGGVGMIVLLLLVAAAASLFISSGRKTAAYVYLEKEIFETEYGVSGMVSEYKARYAATCTKSNILGACLCITALIPFFVSVILDAENDLLMTAMLSVSLVIVSVGVFFFVRSGIIWASCEKLLEEGDYAREKKKSRPVTAALSTVYWLAATAIYLGWSLPTNQWEKSWIVWVIAGLLFPAVITIVNLLDDRKE